MGRMAIAALSPAGSRARLSILIYHRVLREVDPLFCDEPDAACFDMQLQWIKRLFRVLPLDEAIDALRRDALPACAAAITFDDGYADNAEIALPILRRHGVSATFFVTTGFLDGGRMWNDTIIEGVRRARADTLDLTRWKLGEREIATPALRRAAIEAVIDAHKYLPAAQRDARVAELAAAICDSPLPDDLMMRSDQVRALHDAGMGIGAHTVTHPILTRLDAANARREIAEGRAALEHIIDAPVTLFAYPNGKPGVDYTAEHVHIVAESGFSAALSTAWGAATRASDFLQLPRFTPWDRTPARFAARLARNLRLTPAPELA
ncbi:MAG TPA: polysaccharide deacetylase family protein [Casimicrobiaceae bacterium]|nr:polysaccharide deacetylase family protein [Casimicrobiaceae bacterium]